MPRTVCARSPLHFVPNFRSAVGARVAGLPLAGLPIGQVPSVKRNGTATAEATSLSDDLDRIEWGFNKERERADLMIRSPNCSYFWLPEYQAKNIIYSKTTVNFLCLCRPRPVLSCTTTYRYLSERGTGTPVFAVNVQCPFPYASQHTRR